MVISFGIFFFVHFNVYESSRGYNVEIKNWFFTCITSVECLAEGGCAMCPAIQDCAGAAMKSLYCSAAWTLQGHLAIQEVCCSLLLNSECCGFPCSQVLCFRCNWWILWTAEERGCDKLQMGSSVATGSGHDWALSECVRVAGILHRREYLHQPRCSYGHLSKRSICLTVISVLWIFGICYFETPV